MSDKEKIQELETKIKRLGIKLSLAEGAIKNLQIGASILNNGQLTLNNVLSNFIRKSSIISMN